MLRSPFHYQAFASSGRARRTTALALCITCLGLASCDRQDVRFPDDEAITKALQENFASDPDSTQARELVQMLGGERGMLDYKVHNVIYRQGAFEVQYDVTLHMGQAGTESLRMLYAKMIPEKDASKLPEQTLSAYENWLGSSAQSKDGLRTTLQKLGECYRTAKADDSVPLIRGLTVLMSPARNGWHVDKLQSPQMQLECLPL